MIRRLACSLVVLLSACGTVDYDGLEAGEFSGSLLVLWVGENDTGQGDGKFVYIPVPGDELAFKRNVPNPTLPVVKPGVIYTDGGSVPRAAQVFRGFSPWGYAPAYVVHDWLFVARRCVRDGEGKPEELPVANMEFIESAEVLAEAIKGLIEQRKVNPNDVAPQLISSAVAGPISRASWDQAGICKSRDRLSAKHQEKVDEYLDRFGATVRAQGIDPLRRVGDVEPVALIRF